MPEAIFSSLTHTISGGWGKAAGTGTDAVNGEGCYVEPGTIYMCFSLSLSHTYTYIYIYKVLYGNSFVVEAAVAF